MGKAPVPFLDKNIIVLHENVKKKSRKIKKMIFFIKKNDCFIIFPLLFFKKLYII